MSYNWENLFNNENIYDPNPPTGPVVDGPEPPDPMLEWLRRMGIPDVVYDSDISATQEKKTKKQYPALTSLFGAKPIFNLGEMGAAEDGDGGGDDGGEDGGGDPEPGDPDPDPNPDPYPIEIHYPDPGDPYPNPYPDPEPYPYPRQEQPSYPDPLGAVIDTVLGLVFGSAQQAGYYKSDGQTHSSDYKDSVNQMKTSIAALKEAHQIQQKNLDNILQKVASTGSQAEYSQLLNTYAQQKEQTQATQNLTTRIEYAAQNHDYQNVAAEVQNYTIPDQSATTPAPTLSDLDQNDWRYEHNTQLQAGLEKSFGSPSDTPVQHYFQTPVQNYNTVPVQNYTPYQQAPEHNFGNSDLPVFHLGISNDNSPIPIETTNPVTITEGKEVLSSGLTLNDFVKSIGKDIGANSTQVQKVIATYNSTAGQALESQYQKQLDVGIEKIAKECTDAVNATKIAGEISEKVAPYLAVLYIAEQAIEGYSQGGSDEAKNKAIDAATEIFVTWLIDAVLLAIGTAELPAFAWTLIITYILKLAGILR